MKKLSIIVMAALASLAAMSLAAADTYTCVASVATEGGIQPLGTTKVSGTPIRIAASACHEFTRKAFAANKDWSDPDKVCARYPSATTRTVMALDHFQELGTTNGYNRVAGYSCLCDGAKNVSQYPTVPTVVHR